VAATPFVTEAVTNRSRTLGLRGSITTRHASSLRSTRDRTTGPKASSVLTETPGPSSRSSSMARSTSTERPAFESASSKSRTRAESIGSPNSVCTT
jgi:hypothetical protein